MYGPCQTTTSSVRVAVGVVRRFEFVPRSCGLGPSRLGGGLGASATTWMVSISIP
eukprot:TRINITY_DN1992_c1_g1_i1.p5 TRINITY_DN1992_c1_g1~~TRINITY_DN1992_c1_g1_i1.p5  ORF type:complete len:55 (+),score=0.25 TRINITY_DN1992_c1_g1_i1:334-498(+)